MLLEAKQSSILEKITNLYPERLYDFYHSCNITQWDSKTWLVENLNLYFYKHGKRKPLRILILGGWYGLLTYILYDNMGVEFERILSIDFDEKCKEIGKLCCCDSSIINFETLDVGKLDYNKVSSFDIVINTSVEHIEQSVIDRSVGLLKAGTIHVLQSNNYSDIPQHINTSNSEQEFVSNYASQLDNIESFTRKWPAVTKKNLERYMVIGIKK